MSNLKIVCTTSDRYHHCLRIFIYLFNRNWSDKQQVEIVGYKHPDFELPPNFTFYSMGEQSADPSCFSGDLRKYFEQINEDHFLWFFEDSFIKDVHLGRLSYLYSLMKEPQVGRVDLGNQCFRGCTEPTPLFAVRKYCSDRAYRLSTQPSIWSKYFLLKYFNPGLDPWSFERQHPVNDGWDILGTEDGCLKYNEGTTKKDISSLDLHGIPEEQIQEMKQLGILK